MWHYVYILENEKGHQYVGHTDDLNMRLRDHNEGSVPATKSKKPWRIAWFCGFRTPQEAIAWEKHLKTGSGTAIRYKHLAPNKLPKGSPNNIKHRTRVAVTGKESKDRGRS